MQEQRMDWGSNAEPTYKASDWLIFLVSLVVMILLLMYGDRYFWVALPFVFTFLVRALKMM